MKWKKSFHCRVTCHIVAAQADYFTSQIEEKRFEKRQIYLLGYETVVLAFTGTVTQSTTKFLKELGSTLLFSFLKPGINARKHAHKRGRMNYTRSSHVGTDEGFRPAYNAGLPCGMSILCKLL